MGCFCLMEQEMDLKPVVEKYSFPAELLNATVEERKIYFNDYIVMHKFLEKAIHETIRYITPPVSERLVFVCGPSGVGKKVLIKSIKARLVELASQKLIQNPGFVPVVDVQALAPEQGSFNFRGLWKNALEEMDEPMLDHKIMYKDTKGYDSHGRIVTLSNTQKADYQVVLQNTLKYRKVMALIIDEAHHMSRVSSGKKANWSVDLFKSLTNLSQTPIVLVGTYDLTSFLEDLDSKITDQINQRTKIVEFQHYHSEVTSELNIFGKTAKKLLLNMPLEHTAENLVDEDYKYLYKYSLGCIGSLKKWLMDAYSIALEEQAKTLTKKHLEATRISGHRIMGMLESIEKGERIMKEIQSEGNIDKRIVFAEPKSETKGDSEKRHSKSTPKPFNRSPKRDVVM